MRYLPHVNGRYSMRDGGYIDPDRIPTSVVAPILERELEKYKVFEILKDQYKNVLVEKKGVRQICEIVSSTTGVKVESLERYLWNILSCERETASITRVDHFFVALECQHLWYLPPLSEYYFCNKVVNEAA